MSWRTIMVFSAKNSFTPHPVVSTTMAFAEEKLNLVANPEKKFSVIVNNGIIYKKTVK